MNLHLARYKANAQGIFGILTSLETGEKIAVTLEHSYNDGGFFTAKVAPGHYICKRHAPNRLPYETFELQNVPPFYGKPVSGILIHCGNFNKDSLGCILIGEAESEDGTMIRGSRAKFDEFMKLQEGQDSFILVIE